MSDGGSQNRDSSQHSIPERPTKNYVEATKIHQREQTKRTLVMWVGAVALIWVICNAVVKIANKDQPFWVAIVTAICAAISAGALPSWFGIKKFRAYIKSHHNRTVALELERDPGRESSGMNVDGTSPHDT